MQKNASNHVHPNERILKNNAEIQGGFFKCLPKARYVV